MKRIVLVTPDLADNSLGRTFALWLMARHLGWDARVVSSRGEAVWGPLSSSEFARACFRLNVARSPDSALSEFASDADLLIAVKPLDESFGLARHVARAKGVPLLLDVDDPDIEVRTRWLGPHLQLWRWVSQPSRQVHLRRLRRWAQQTPTIVSNPMLQSLYGGPIVPHVRPAREFRQSGGDGDRIRVAFVGSPKAHKGLEDLRTAIETLAPAGFRLTVTGEAPPDANPWETWVGTVPFPEAMRIIDHSDVVAITSRESSWARAQLPAKLVDAMMAGKAVIVTDVGPMRWAVGDTGLVIPPANPTRLREALQELSDRKVRADYGERAWRRAHNQFSVERVSVVFKEACEAAMRREREES